MNCDNITIIIKLEWVIYKVLHVTVFPECCPLSSVERPTLHAIRFENKCLGNNVSKYALKKLPIFCCIIFHASNNPHDYP